MSNLPYDNDRMRQQIIHAPSVTGLSVPGTAASNTVLLRIPMSVDSVKLNTIRVRYATGGTAAGPSFTVGKSLAGTGTVTAIGTVTSGTAADGVCTTVSLTSTEFDATDEIVITNLAGTAAATPTVVFSLGYKEV